MRATGSVRVCRVDRIHLHTGDFAVAVTAWTVQAGLRLGTAGRSRREILAARGVGVGRVDFSILLSACAVMILPDTSKATEKDQS